MPSSQTIVNKSRDAAAPLKSARVKGQQARGGISKERILAVATRMFAERGFTAISIRDIAKACKISIPSIYHFYGDKESLYDACYHTTFEAAAETLHGTIFDAKTPESGIRSFTVKLCEIIMEDHNFRRLLQRELLREERRQIDVLTTHHFNREFVILTAEIEKLSGKEHALERAFSIYALVFGLIQLRRIGELAGMDKSVALSPAHLAEHVLEMVFPHGIFSQKSPVETTPVVISQRAKKSKP